MVLSDIHIHTHTHTHCHISFKMASHVLLAAEQGDRKSMQAFITDRQVNVVNEEGCTPLMVAAANGRDEIIRLLLEQEVSNNKILILNCN